MWPHVRQVVSNIREEAPIPARVLSNECRLMTQMKRFHTQPRWQFAGCRQRLLGSGRVHPQTCRQLGHQRPGARIAASCRLPHRAHLEAVPHKRFGVTNPHPGRGVVPPAVPRHGKGSENLQRLHSLLAQPLRVQNPRRVGKARQWQKRLHRLQLPGTQRAQSVVEWSRTPRRRSTQRLQWLPDVRRMRQRFDVRFSASALKWREDSNRPMVPGTRESRRPEPALSVATASWR
jgi:hypothetical protein